jgi:hypothetical protein
VEPVPATGAERGEVGGGLRGGVHEAAGEPQLVDAGAGLQASERGVGEHLVRQEVGSGLAGGQGVREPGVDVALNVMAGTAGQQVPHRFVTLPGFGQRQGAELAQRLELIGAGLGPGLLAQAGFARGVGRQVRPRDVVRVPVIDGARPGCGEQLVDAFPLRELRAAARVVGQVLVPGGLPGEEARFLEGGRDRVEGNGPIGNSVSQV